MKRVFILVLLLGLVLGPVLMLAGCGGGGDDEDEAPQQQAPHVDCQARPEACR